MSGSSPAKPFVDVESQGGPSFERPAEAFRIGGHLIRIVDPPCALDPFRAGGGAQPVRFDLAAYPADAEAAPTRVVGWLGSREREVVCRPLPGGFHIGVEAAGEYVVQQGGGALSAVPPRNSDDDLYQEALLGPPLLLALALRGTFCLHASAVARGGAGLAILGDSGRGKSTLARWLGERASGWRWLSDDITPVRPGPEGTLIEPAFPQLKVTDRRESVPQAVGIRGWVMLRPTRETSPRLEALGERDRFVALISSVAAARLLPPDLAGRAFDACSEVARQVSGHRLHYPHRWEVLPSVADLLERLAETAGEATA